MKRTISLLLLFLTIVAGCSGPPTTEKEKKEPQATTAPAVEEIAAATDQQHLADLKRQAVPRPAPAAEATGAASGIAHMKARRVGGLVGDRALNTAGPQWNRESYNAITENRFINAAVDSLSTFSIDVDTASYANVRRFVTAGSLPPVGAVRIEEMINYFPYAYPEPKGSDPVALDAEVGPSPFHPEYRLVRIALKGKDQAKEQLPPSNLVFLIDVSGSMQDANKLPLLKQALHLLVKQLGKRDRVALVVYAGSDSVVLPPTSGDRQKEILAAIDRLQSGGSTHASSGIQTAYQLARQSFMPGGNNRIILTSDGDFNVGVTSRDELQRLIEKERQGGIYLTVLGFGMGNYHDDTMEILADKGNGNYAYIDSLLEAKKVMVKELSGTLYTLANDVKIQVEFNPGRVGAYRLIGYENRALADEDFRDDSKDAGEIGVGHRVTALYELIPAGHGSIPVLDPLKYQAPKSTAASTSQELLTVTLRYKPLGADKSQLIGLPVKDRASGNDTSADFRFAAAVAGYGMLLTHSDHLGTFTWDQCLAMVRSGRGTDAEGYRGELYRLVEMSQLLAQQQGRSPSAPPEGLVRPHSMLK
jgi:Ca-activated chloride channel family protein